MSDLLSVAELREHIQTALPDDALQRIIDANDGAISRACGLLTIGDYETPDVVTEYATIASESQLIWLKRRPDTIEDVTLLDETGEVETVLVADDDYWLDGSTLRRRGYYWGRRIKIEYVPMNDAAERRLLLIQLCQLAVNVEPGMTFAGAATWQETYRNYEAEKQSLIWAYCPPHPFA